MVARSLGKQRAGAIDSSTVSQEHLYGLDPLLEEPRPDLCAQRETATDMPLLIYVCFTIPFQAVFAISLALTVPARHILHNVIAWRPRKHLLPCTATSVPSVFIFTSAPTPAVLWVRELPLPPRYLLCQSQSYKDMRCLCRCTQACVSFFGCCLAHL